MLIEHTSSKPRPPRASGRLNTDDAIDIWIARWLRVRVKDLVTRYECDPRRLYEIWAEDKFIGSRDRARQRFLEQHPQLADRVDFGTHQTIHRGIDPDSQPGLFDDA